jgi:pimeloyl-ACP methyl ester carboxylesterase
MRPSFAVPARVIFAILLLGILLQYGSGQSSVQVTLSPTTTPASASPGVTNVSVVGSNFPAGNIPAANVTITLTGPLTTTTTTTTATAVTTITGTTRRVAFTVPASLSFGAPTTFAVKISGSTTAPVVSFQSANPAQLIVNPGATLISVTPTSAIPGQTLPVAIVGSFTHFVQGSTVANFGAGITVSNVSVIDPTHANVNITVSTTATGGPRRVTMTTGTEVAAFANVFTVQAPGITSVTPNSGQQGTANVPVTIAGNFTHFSSSSIVTFGNTAVTAGAPTSATATSITVPVSITATATPGVTSVTVSTGTEVLTLANAFTVNPGTPSITGINPNSVPQGGLNVPVTITGRFTHFSSLSVVTFSCAGLNAGPTTAASATSLTFPLTISATTPTGPCNVIVTTGGEVVTAPTGFAVTPGGPVISSVNPNTGAQGANNLPVTITGNFTHFSTSSVVTFAVLGVTAGTPAAATATSITVPVSITAAATLGATNVVVTTGTEVVTLQNGFTVTNGSPMISGVNPNTGQQGAANIPVTITGAFTHFTAASVVTFANVAVTAGTPSAATGTSLTVPVSITSAANLGATDITVTTGTEVVTLQKGFTVTNGSPMISTVSPNTAPQGATAVPVTITGLFTHFSPSSVVTFSNTAVTAGTPTAATATSITVPVSITATAAIGASDLTVTTGTEVVKLTGGFIVGSGATISSINPNTGQQGAVNIPVTITGTSTHFSTSSTVTFGNPAVTAGLPTAATAASLTVPVSIAGAASPGQTNVTVTTGTEIVTLANGFTVIPAPASITLVNPNTGFQGQQNLAVNITGSGTHFVQGTTTATFRGGITVVSLTINSATSASAVINIDMAAPIGADTVTLTTGTETASLIGGFTVQAGPPMISLTSPQNLSFLNLSPTTVNGTVSDPNAKVSVNFIPATVANGQFSVQVPLAEGPNIVTATATSTSGLTGTASIAVTLDTTPPHVTITSPPDQFTTTVTSISVSGTVNDIVVGTVNSQQATVTVNGAPAQVANRTFLASNVPLSLGNNTIQAVAVDQAGNSANTSITVIRQAPSSQPQISLISGDGQSGAINLVLTSPLVVALKDGSGNPVPNTNVIFKVTQNNGLVGGGSAGQSSAVVQTNAQGLAQTTWTLGGRAGAGGNTVEAYAVGFSGTAIFTATGNQGSAGKIVVDSGNNQTGVVGAALPLPLIAVVIDAGNNRLANVPVTFTVKGGGGAINGAPNITVTTDSDGRAGVTLTLGLQEGNANNLVTADFAGDTGFAAAFTASGRAAGARSKTVVSGVVLDNTNQAVPGVTIRAVLTNQLTSSSSSVNVAATVTTDTQGQFSIPQAPIGYVKLIVDGSTATRAGTWPSLEYDLVTISGQNNTLDQPVYLLPLNPANQLCVTATTGGGTLTIPEAPGFSLTFGPGQVTFPGGSQTGCISVTVVHGDKVPMQPGFGQQPRFIVTIQPPGALFNPPAPITLPNVDGLKPREVTEMYSFDHDIGSFVAIGTGVVSDDGQVIRSSPGVGVLKAGWHCGGNSQTSGAAAQCGPCAYCDGTNCQPNSLQGNTCQNDCIVGGSGTCTGGYCKPTCNTNGQCGQYQPPNTPCGSGGLCDGMGNCILSGGCTCNSGNPCITDSCGVNGQCLSTVNNLCQNACSGKASGASCSVTNAAGAALNGICDSSGNCNLCGSLGLGAGCTCGGGGTGSCNGTGQCTANGQVCSGLAIHLTWRGQTDPQIIYIRQGKPYPTQGMLSATTNSPGGTFTWSPVVSGIVNVTGSGNQVNLNGMSFGSTDLFVSYVDPNGQTTSTLVLVTVIYPVVLVHGIASDDTTWSALAAAMTSQYYNLIQNGPMTMNYCNGASADYDFCAVNFATDPRTQPWGNLSSFATEGSVLASIIAYVQSVTGASKVTLVAHSMGGLASRYAIQSGASGSVYKLITLGTPHLGSVWANLITNTTIKGTFPSDIASFVSLNPSSPGVQSLETTSAELTALNSGVSAMSNVLNVAIVGIASTTSSLAATVAWNAYVANECANSAPDCSELTQTLLGINEILTNGDLIVADGSQEYLFTKQIAKTRYYITATHLGETGNATAIADILQEITQ